MSSVARNQPCPCGSGKKYKHCCLASGGAGRDYLFRRAGWIAVAVAVAAAAAGWLAGREAAGLVALGGALVVGAYLLFGDPPPPRSGGSPGAINFGR
jgi:hypothetical protein